MTRNEFLARCATAYDAGLIHESSIRVFARWVDIVCRLQGGQLSHVLDALRDEQERTHGFRLSLANDTNGYAIVQWAAILTHPCEECARDTQAWWTRAGFCEHREATK